jgi:hypothetical protein
MEKDDIRKAYWEKNITAFLDVRNLSFHTMDIIEAALDQHNFLVADVQSLATGFMVRGTKKNEWLDSMGQYSL